MVGKVCSIATTIILLSSFALAVDFSDDFETGDYGKWDAETESSGACDIDSNTVFQGSFSSKFSLSAEDGYAYLEYWTNVGNSSTIYGRAYYFFPSVFDVDDYESIMQFQEGNPYAVLALLYLNSDEKFQIQYAGPSWTGTSSVSVTKNKWVCIEMKLVIHDTAGELRVWMDGVEILTATGIDTKSTNDTIGSFQVGNLGGGTQTPVSDITYYVDNAIVDSSPIGQRVAIYDATLYDATIYGNTKDKTDIFDSTLYDTTIN